MCILELICLLWPGDEAAQQRTAGILNTTDLRAHPSVSWFAKAAFYLMRPFVFILTLVSPLPA